LSAPELFVRHDGLASALATARLGCIEAGAGSFADEVALELSERAENVKDEPSAGCGGINRFCQRAEADAARFQAVHCLDQVRQRAAEPIELRRVAARPVGCSPPSRGHYQLGLPGADTDATEG
jgi:hypothetical protein